MIEPEKLCNVSKELLYMCLYGGCIIVVSLFISGYCEETTLSKYYDTAELETTRIIGAEYLLVGTNRNVFSNKIKASDSADIKVTNRKGSCIELLCDTGMEECIIEVPLYNYKGYQVTDELGKQYEISMGKNNTISFMLPADFNGKVTIEFVTPWYWTMSLYISIISVLLFVWKYGMSKKSSRCVKK